MGGVVLTLSAIDETKSSGEYGCNLWNGPAAVPGVELGPRLLFLTLLEQR